MPRPNRGPHLVTLRKQGWTRAKFYIRWHDATGPHEHATPFDTTRPGDAEAYLADWLHQRAREFRRAAGRPGDPDQVTVVDVLEDYAKEIGPGLATADKLAYTLAPLLHFLRDDTLWTLTPNRVRAYWDWRRVTRLNTEQIGDTITTVAQPGRVADGTIIRELAGALRPAIRHAIQEKRLMPGEYYVPVPPAPPGRDRWLSRDEAATLLWESRRDPRSRLHLPLFILVALYTGARSGAILDLRWPQIDLVRAQIDFNPRGRVQTAKGRPVIPVPRSLLAALRRAHRRASSEFVIAYHGAPVGSVKTGFNSAAERAGIADLTIHTLRHTAGTWMAQEGVPLWQIGGYLGHSVARTTELYSHHSPEHLGDARRALEGGAGRGFADITRTRSRGRRENDL